MPTPLDEWQKRLEGHFDQLADARSTSGFPLFALEHGLTQDEIGEIGVLLRARLAGNLWLGSHWLLWVVYAAELGYDYYGDEYWPSFEERTPHWRERGSRNQLRSWFLKFHETYNGVKPSGQWAEWFSIIAWPITHAILPRDLQGQFAKALYDLRYRLTHIENLSPLAVGQLLAANAWDMSSRFREFLQQEELAGRIALALLSDREMQGESPIYPPTLQKLVSDLEKVQNAREWLKETRRFVADRIKGAAHTHVGTSSEHEVRHAVDVDHAASPPSIRPNLVLRPSGNSTWSVVIEVPSFASVAQLDPELRVFLKSTRCQVAGTGGTWLPTGWLLSSAQRRVLKSWPGGATPLVRFERPNEKLDHLVDSETRLSAGPIWLFRVGADGLAREIVGRVVRPGRKYVVLSDGDLTLAHPLLAACEVDCEGIRAAAFSLPDIISSHNMDQLQQLGLQVARTVRIWPAGLLARGWDGEGQSEWLTTEFPCFGIVHDHPLKAYSLRLNNGPATLIEAGGVGSPVFVKLSLLPVGKHMLSVKAQRGYQDSAIALSPTAEGVVTLHVREPEPWIPGTTSYAGLAVSLDPHDPSLDTFWEGNLGLTILGPIGHQVTCSIKLLGTSGRELLSEQIGTFELPVTTEEWRKKLPQFLNDDRRTWTYLEAIAGRFLIRGEELGEYSIRLERDVKPVRWVCHGTHGSMTLRLIDNTGSDDAAICRFFSFRCPANSIILDAENFQTGFQVQTPGGLFEAKKGEFLSTIVVSTPQIEGGLQGLVIEPDLHDIDNATIQVIHVLNLVRLWSEAYLVGPLVGMRRDRILNRVLNRLYSRLCGSRWAMAEAAYLSSPDSPSTIQQLQRMVGGISGFPAVLRRDYEQMEASTQSGTQWFAEIAARYQICSDKGLCEFALQLASRPHHLLLLPTSMLEQLLLDIKAMGVLLRGARLLALLSGTKNPGFAGTALPRWKWL